MTDEVSTTKPAAAGLAMDHNSGPTDHHAATNVGAASLGLPASALPSNNPSTAAIQRVPPVQKHSNFVDVTGASYSTTTMSYGNNAMSNMNLVKQTEEQELLDMIEKGYGSAGRAQQLDPSNPLAALASHRKKSTPGDAVRIDPWDMLKHIDHYDIQEFNAWDLAREINWNYRELLFDPTGKNVYLDACSFLGVIPNSSFVRALEHTQRERAHSTSTTTSSKQGGAAADSSKQTQSAASTMNANNNNKKYQMDKPIHREQQPHSSPASNNSGSPFEANGMEIDLSSSGLNDVACRAVCIGIVNNTSITSLKLADNNVGPVGADYIQQLFRTNLYIVDIDLSNNQLGHEGCRYVCYYLLTKKCHMRVLRTARNQWGDREIPLVAAAMERNRSLLLWDLSHNGFTEKCGQLFGAALGENDTLVELDLSYNRIRGRGFAAFFPGFKNNVRLTALKLAFNDLGDRATMLFADSLKAKTNLVHIDLSSCNINQLSVERFLVKVLPTCEELRTLKLGHNPITHQGAYVLLTVCAESTHIELLDLSGITVQPKFIKYLDAYNANPKRPFQVLHNFVMELKGPMPPQPKMIAAGGGKKKDKKKR